MSIKVLRPGLLSSIQDLGRFGYQKHGVIASGAMDVYALRVANLLVGNEEGAGALEMTLVGPELEIPEGTLLAVTGGDLAPVFNGKPLPMWRPVYIKRTGILKLGAAKSGCRAYLAVGGGYNIPVVMGSKSTYLKAGIGGFKGRALAAGDELCAGSLSTQTKKFGQVLKKLTGDFFAAPRWYAPHRVLHKDITVRVTSGGQFNEFSEESRHEFLHSPFTVTTRSDRMGYRLTGAVLNLQKPLEMISEAVAFGTVQVPPDGNPIILMADRQTAGGYPKIGQVALVDLPLIAQIKPGSKISFTEVSLRHAEELYLRREVAIKSIKAAVILNLKE